MITGTVAWCIMMGNMTQTAENLKREGRPEPVAAAMALLHTDPRLREAETLVVRYVYSNDDNALTPRQMNLLVRNACEKPDA